MSDDLVYRLRDTKSVWGGSYAELERLLVDSSDEIVRLRKNAYKLPPEVEMKIAVHMTKMSRVMMEHADILDEMAGLFVSISQLLSDNMRKEAVVVPQDRQGREDQSG